MPDLPLLGTTILLTAHRRAEELGSALERRGAQVRHAPVLSIVSHVDDADLVAQTRRLIDDPPDVVIATTGVGFRGWIEAADAAGLAPQLLEVLGKARLIARGPKAQGAIHGAGLVTDWVAQSETAAEIKETLTLEGVSAQHIAVQHHGSGSDGLDDLLTALGNRVTSLVVYRWGPPPNPELVDAAVRELADGRVDCIVFTSAPGATAFLSAADKLGLRDEVATAMHNRVLAAAVGPVTAAPLVEAGVEPLVPDRYRMGALVREITARLSGRGVTEVSTRAGTLQITRTSASLDGRDLSLSPGSLELLRMLVHARGAVVSRQALLEVLPGASMDEHRIEVAVARLRESLGAPVVSTVVRRGYRIDVT
ncbi:MAG TPA: uroporphyrinogen-III synthase [Propionibacteriaceae bacterium]|nr:uroporphyrinogen-III synthase [Propionibacteriaceae bacterium]